MKRSTSAQTIDFGHCQPYPSNPLTWKAAYLRSGLPACCEGDLLMLGAYLDESQTAGDGRELLVLAGYVAPTEAWVEFSEEWASVLSRYNVTHFHSTEIKTQHSKLYRHLSHGQRRNMVSELAEIIGRHVTMGLSVCMHPGDWRAATTHEFRSKAGSPYGICAELLLWVASEVMSKAGEPETISLFLESGHKNEMDAILRLTHYRDDTKPLDYEIPKDVRTIGFDPLRTWFVRINSIASVNKIVTKPVQAADLFAYLASQSFRKSPATGVFEGIFTKLIRTKPHVYRAWNTLERVGSLVKTIQSGEVTSNNASQDIWRLSTSLRALGFKVNRMPGGALMIDWHHMDAQTAKGQWMKFIETTDE